MSFSNFLGEKVEEGGEMLVQSIIYNQTNTYIYITNNNFKQLLDHLQNDQV